MLTDADVKKLIQVFATRDEVVLKADLDRFREDFSDLQTSIDAYARKADAYFQEMVMLSHRVERHEKWMHQLAEKLGIKLEY